MPINTNKKAQTDVMTRIGSSSLDPAVFIKIDE
jgi:hypothetical protein